MIAGVEEALPAVNPSSRLANRHFRYIATNCVIWDLSFTHAPLSPIRALNTGIPADEDWNGSRWRAW
jgi:hypothetical protein